MKRWLVSGWRGSGKTSFCLALVQAARAAGWDAGGVLSPGVFEGGKRVAIDALAVRSGERRRLANLARASECDLAFGDWFFDRQTLAWGNRVLEASLNCELLVIDELGPLELTLGDGWVKGLEVLERGAYRLGVVVVRPELADAVSERLGGMERLMMDGTAQVAEHVRQLLGERGGDKHR